jgi:hypothetical protein
MASNCSSLSRRSSGSSAASCCTSAHWVPGFASRFTRLFLLSSRNSRALVNNRARKLVGSRGYPSNFVGSSPKSPQQVAKNCVRNPKHRNTETNREGETERETHRQKKILRAVAKLHKKIQKRGRETEKPTDEHTHTQRHGRTERDTERWFGSEGGELQQT